ncbi:hypothetical protein [Devosia lacusdianchii]|uniref:hypothetical protein n=1 Tax=Devosia lacusdianchii TaxID=2917991 RepID=UPI001F050B57|nr:hypothetical protein [Devosia sp. JXJ CY 41]
MSVANMLALVGCLLGYMLAGIMVDLSLVSGLGATLALSFIPSLCGLVIGLTAMRLHK